MNGINGSYELIKQFLRQSGPVRRSSSDSMYEIEKKRIWIKSSPKNQTVNINECVQKRIRYSNENKSDGMISVMKNVSTYPSCLISSIIIKALENKICQMKIILKF